MGEDHDVVPTFTDAEMNVGCLRTYQPDQLMQGLKERWCSLEFAPQTGIEIVVADMCPDQPPQRRIFVSGGSIEE